MTNRAFSRIFPLILLSTVLIFTNSCKKDSSSTRQIKVGVLLGFSGTGSQNATETQAALDICLDDVKSYLQRNGLDANVELFYEDTQSDTNVAKTKAQSLIDRGVRIIIGPYTSSEAKAVKAIADAKNVLLVSHSAVSTSLAIPGDNFLRFSPCDTYQAEAICSMFDSDSVKAIIPIVRVDLWSNSLFAATNSTFTSQGGSSLTIQSFTPGTTDFSSLAAGVNAAIATASAQYGADRIAIYLISYGDGTSVLEALVNAGVSPAIKVYGASAFAQSTTLTANATAAGFASTTNFQCPVFGFDASASNIYEPIQTKIVAKIGNKASIYALAAYDILWAAVLSAITQQADADFATFKSHFIETAGEYFGATGRTELDENGDRKRVFYDFWGIKNNTGLYSWQITAKYNTSDHSLTKY
ncbi:MAG: ABC transporter substrate-binding protein [Bacteroidota bacterium]